MRTAGEAVGIDFTGKTDRAPNTVGAHTLLKTQEGHHLQNKLQEILFRHYFTDGLYPNPQNLRRAAEEAGVDDVDGVMALIESDDARKAVQAEAADYSRRGVSGVPFFIFNGKPQFSGAQPVHAMERALLASLA